MKGRGGGSLLGTKFTTIDNPVAQLSVGLGQVIVDNDLIMSARLFGELQFVLRLLETLAQALLRFRPTTTQSGLQFFKRRRRKEQEPGIQISKLDLFHALVTQHYLAPCHARTSLGR